MLVKRELKAAPKPPVQNGKRTSHLISGERSYVEKIFIKHKLDIQRYLNSIVCSEEDASDLTQETYLKVCSRENIAKLNQNIKGYLFVVASNLAKDFIRKKATRHEHKHVSITDLELASREESPENMAEWRESLKRIKSTLLTLDNRCKQVFIMRRFMGYSTREIASTLNVSKKTIERELIVAFEQIKCDLQKQKYYDQ